MNANRKRFRACERKVSHPSQKAAFQALLSLVSATGAYKGRLNTYGCKYCGGFHVGRRKLANEKWV